jgi:hypothetical protein
MTARKSGGSVVTGLVKGIFGGDSASRRQERLLRQQEAELKAVEAGQRRLREGGRGLLAYIDGEEEEDNSSGGGKGFIALARAARKFGGLS